MRPNAIDLTGKVYGSWRVWKKCDGKINGRITWLVRCQRCGEVFNKVTRDLTRRKRRPYGCKACKWGDV